MGGLAAQGLGPQDGVSGRTFPLIPQGGVPDQYIVVFQDDVTNPRGVANAMARDNGIGLQFVYEHALKGFAGRMPAPIAQALAFDPNVAYVEQDVYAHAVDLVTGVDRIDADLNFMANFDGNDDRVDVDVAILDTGINQSNPDLNVVESVDCTVGVVRFRCRDGGSDGNGHGTHVAGTVGALDNGVDFTFSDGTDIEVVGVAPGARLWAVKVLADNGTGSMSMSIAGIDWVTARAGQIEVVNMSLGGVGTLASLQTAMQNSVNAGVVYVVAAGNESEDVYGPDGTFNTSDDHIPAAYPVAATISAMADFDGRPGGEVPDADATVIFQSACSQTAFTHTGDDVFACLTNYSNVAPDSNPNTSSGIPVSSPGAAIDLAAPGIRIISTYGLGYNWGSGTSMASPHAAGAVALYIAENGRAIDATDVADIRQALIDAAQPQSAWGPGDTEDPDANHEGLVYVADANGAAPVVSWATPDGIMPVSGTVPIQISASDAEDDPDPVSGLMTVNWRVGGGSWQPTTFNFGYYEADWITTGGSYPDGDYVLEAETTDMDGNRKTATVTVTVDNVDEPPSVSITNPTGGTVSGTVTVTADASDDGGVLHVEFLVDGSSIGTDFDGTDGWSTLWVTTNGDDGDYNLTAEATDNAAQTADSGDPVVVTVDNSGSSTVSIPDLDGITYQTSGGRNRARRWTLRLQGLTTMVTAW
jgi:subtilisin family serine protease